jgi:phosphate transport system protein
MNRRFHGELATLKADLLRMGDLAQSMVELAVRALVDRDTALLGQVRAAEEEMNKLHLALDERCFTLLALQQPTAGDLRFLLGAVKSVGDLERIGDQSVSIAKSAEQLIQEPPLKPLIDIPKMAELARGMVHDSLGSLVSGDYGLARTVLLADDAVDSLRDEVFRELLTHMTNDPDTVARALQLILISRSLERIADHATNIAEDVIFITTAADVRHHAMDGFAESEDD